MQKIVESRVPLEGLNAELQSKYKEIEKRDGRKYINIPGYDLHYTETNWKRYIEKSISEGVITFEGKDDSMMVKSSLCLCRKSYLADKKTGWFRQKGFYRSETKGKSAGGIKYCFNESKNGHFICDKCLAYAETKKLSPIYFNKTIIIGLRG